MSLVAAVQQKLPDVTPAGLLRLELPNIKEEDELSIITLASTVLMEIWKKRLNQVRIRLYDIRATLEARCLLLREPRFSAEIESLGEVLNHFHHLSQITFPKLRKFQGHTQTIWPGGGEEN